MMDNRIVDRMHDLEDMIAPWIWPDDEESTVDLVEHSKEVIPALIYTAYYLWKSIGSPEDVSIEYHASETSGILSRGTDGVTKIGKHLRIKTRSVADFFSIFEGTTFR